MMTYNLLSEEKELLEQALSLLIQVHDQYKADPKKLQRILRKVKESTRISFITQVKRP